MRWARVTAMVVAGLLAGPAAAEACSLVAVAPATLVQHADAAVYGTVSSVRLGAPREGAPGRPFTARVRVLRVYKGRIGPAVRVRGHTDGAACGFGTIRRGQRVGLLLSGRRPWSVGLGDRLTRADLDRATRGRWHRPGPA